ncbi:Uncharacterised protein [Shigella flexneri]|nr:Uncharacterised protein [Shigella sonnei]SRN44420.1 Uncharacterised protein [Shigella flexneri]
MVNINTSAISVDQTQSILSMSIPLFSCFLIPENCFTGIGFDSQAFQVDPPQFALCARIFLFC